jgi:hypothetical protein
MLNWQTVLLFDETLKGSSPSLHKTSPLETILSYLNPLHIILYRVIQKELYTFKI